MCIRGSNGTRWIFDVSICWALVGTLTTYLAGLVFALQQERCDPSVVALGVPDACLSTTLEYLTIVVILATCCLGIFASVSVWRTVAYKKEKGVHAYLDETVEKQRQEQEKLLAARKGQVSKQHARLRSGEAEKEAVVANDAEADDNVVDDNPMFDTEQIEN